MAEYAYASHLRDNGHTGEIIYPNKDTSKQQTEAMAFINNNRERLGTVSPNGTVRLT